MNKLLKITSSLVLCVGLMQASYAQEVVQVDPYTGSLNGSIPLLTVKSRTLSYPVTAFYHTNGQKVESGPGNMGTGWNLPVTPVISKVVNDLPDDVDTTVGGRHLYGWLNGGGAKVAAITDTAPLSSCDDDTVLVNQLEELGGFSSTDDIYDLEPDVYYVNVPGHLGFSFVFDTNGDPVIRGSGDYDITIENNVFTIIAPGQIVYEFYWHTPSYISLTNASEGFYNKKTYFNYKDYFVFHDRWDLVRISGPTGDAINFDYETLTPVWGAGFTAPDAGYTIDTLRYFTLDDSLGTYEEVYRMETILTQYFGAELIGISSELQRLEIRTGELVLPQGDYKLETNQINGIELFDERTDELIGGFAFEYATVLDNEKKDYDDTLSDDFHSHIYLSGISRVNENSIQQMYSFEYYGIDLENNQSLFTDRETLEKDEFGFYGAKDDTLKLFPKTYCYPDLDPANQYRWSPISNYEDEMIILDGFVTAEPDQRMIQNGSLRMLTNETGGSQMVSYELNTYYDSLNDASAYGGGVRVKQLLLHDGVDRANDIIKQFSYDDAGKSSGRLIYKPTYAVQFPTYYSSYDSMEYYYGDLADSTELSTADIWKAMTMRSDQDLTKQYDPGYNVAYTVINEKIVGAGSRTFHFNIPLDYDTRSHSYVSIADLNRTLDKPELVSGFTCLYDNFKDMFKQLQPTDISWNGSLASVKSYDALDTLVSERINTYEAKGVDKIVEGLKLEKHKQRITIDTIEVGGTTYYDYPQYYDAYLFSKYSLPLGRSDVVTKTINKIYNDQGQALVDSVTYTYDDLLRVTKETRYTPDGKTYTSHRKYADEYSVTKTVRDDMSEALDQMQNARNFNNMPIEMWSGYMDGATEKITTGQFSEWIYDTSAKHFYRIKSYSFTSKDGLSGFQASSVTNGASSDFTYNSNYELDQEVISRTYDNKPAATLTRGILKSGAHYGRFGEVKLAISGAYEDEVLFTDFETHHEYDDVSYDSLDLTAGRISGNGLALSTTDNIQNTISNGGDEYVVSFWYHTTDTGKISIDINTAGASGSIPLDDTAGDWMYAEITIDVSSLSGDLTFELTSNVAVTVDDVQAFPSHANTVHTLYGTGFRQLAVTNSNGVTNSYEYDDFNRPKLSRNKDDEIAEYTEYKVTAPVMIARFWTYLPTERYAGDSLEFTVSEVTGAQYHWKIVTPTQFTTSPYDFTGANVESALSWKWLADTAGVYVIMIKAVTGTDEELAHRQFSVRNRALTVSLCADRPTLTDLCNPDAGRGSCEVYGTPTTNTVKISAFVTEGDGSYNYAWYQYTPAGAGLYTKQAVGTNSSSLTVSNYHDYTYGVEVTDGVGKEGTSSKLIFTTFKSDPSCPE